MIEARGLTRSFGEVRAVDGVSFRIEPGEVVGLLGPNGAGKTTTMRILTTFLAADAGDAVVFGASIRDAPLEVRRRTGYLPEGAPLYPEMTIEPYLAWMGRMRGLDRSTRRRRVAAMLEACGLGDVLDREIGQLSRGYRQRVGLAATLLHAPDFLILDEPTSGLDPNQVAEFRRLLRTVGQDRTVLLSTHILAEVEATCDRVLILAGGRVLADAPTDQLRSRRFGAARWRVGVRGDAATACAALAGAPFAAAVEVLEEREGVAFLRVVAAAGTGGAEQVFHRAVEQRLVLVELSEERTSLEAVFAALTRGAEA